MAILPKSIQDLFLPVTRSGAWPSLLIHSSSPQAYSESVQEGEKNFPCWSEVSCNFFAGVWMAVVVNGFTAAIKITFATC